MPSISSVRIFTLFLAILFCRRMHSQAVVPTRSQFKASVATVQASGERWRKLIDSVKIDDLQVEYATGKTYEKAKDVVLQNLKLTLLWAGRAGQSGHLFDEVSYLSTLQELQSQLESFSTLMIDFRVADKAQTLRVVDWSTAMSDIAARQVNTAYTSAYLYITNHAAQVDAACAKP